jgi:lipid II:glycine glycyltransferase (peptidoglycan interpeptide bridge formation enzyme)
MIKSSWPKTLKICLIETYLITLNQPAAEYLTTNVQRAQRQHIRTNEREGLEMVHHPGPELTDEYYDLYLRVWSSRNWGGKQFSRSFFHGVCNTLGKGGELAVIRHQGKVVGGGVMLFDRYAVHLFQATMDREVKGIYPHVFLYKSAIEEAEKRGLRYVNLGGINKGNTGLQRFKQEWGATATPIPTIKWYHNGFGRLKRTAFHAMLRMKVVISNLGTLEIC